MSSGTEGGEESKPGCMGSGGEVVPELGCQEKQRWVSANLGGLRSVDSPSSGRCPRRGVGRHLPGETLPWSPRTGIPHIPITLLFTLGTPARIRIDGGVVGTGVSPQGAITKDPGMGPSARMEGRARQPPLPPGAGHSVEL